MSKCHIVGNHMSQLICDDIHGPILFLYWKTEVSTQNGGISKMFVINGPHGGETCFPGFKHAETQTSIIS